MPAGFFQPRILPPAAHVKITSAQNKISEIPAPLTVSLERDKLQATSPALAFCVTQAKNSLEMRPQFLLGMTRDGCAVVSRRLALMVCYLEICSHHPCHPARILRRFEHGAMCLTRFLLNDTLDHLYNS